MFRVAVIFIVIHFMNCDLVAQQKPYVVNSKNEPLEKVFQKLEASTPLKFSYSTEDVSNYEVTINLEVFDKETIIEALLKETTLSYIIKDEYYIIITNLLDKQDSLELCGRIIDHVSKQPLSFANIYHARSYSGTSTDESGNFNLNLYASDIDTITVSYIGYENQSIRISDLEQMPCRTIELKQNSSSDLFIVVTDYLTNGITLEDNGLATKIKLDKLTSAPGSVDGDISSLAKMLPGVSSPTSKASDVFIRGTTPDQTLITWERIPIYHAAHYFGMISALNPYIIDEMNVYRGGFGVENGGRIGGLIELSTDSIGTDEVIGIGSSMTSSYLYARKKIPMKRDVDFNLSLRRSFHELTPTPTYDQIASVNSQELLLGRKDLSDIPPHITISKEFNFLDGQLCIKTKASKNDDISLAVLFAAAGYQDVINDKRTKIAQTDTTDSKNIGANFSWIRKWSNRFKTRLDLVSADYEFKYDYAVKESMQPEPSVRGVKDNYISDYQLRMQSTYQTSKSQLIQGGYHLIYNKIQFGVFEKNAQNPQPVVDDGEITSGEHHSLYLSFKNPVSNVMGINGGIRGSYYSTTKQFYLEPRLQLSYQIIEGLLAHLYAGRHHQFVAQISGFRGNNNGIRTELWALSGGMSIPVQKADIIQLGLLYNKKGWTIDLQAFYKHVGGVTSNLFQVPQIPDSRILKGTIEVAGADILVNKRLGWWNTWLGYSLSKVEATFRMHQPSSFPTNYDQRHVLSFVNQATIGMLNISLGLQYASGLPYNEVIDYKITSMAPLNFKYVYGEPYENRLSESLQFNLSAEYRLTSKLKPWSAYFSVAAVNLFNRDNPYTRNYFVKRPKASDAEIAFVDKNNLGFTPNVSVRLVWE